MATSFTLGPQVNFHVGDTINVYAATSTGLVSPGVIATSTVAADSTTTFTDLQTSARYAAGETVTGPFVYFSTFNTSTAAATGGGARVLAWDAGTETYDHPEWWPDTDERREFIGPTNPATVDGITLALYDVWTVTA